MKLHEKLALHLSDTVAVIGAGGKTTALWRLAEERRDAGAPVLVTTSTHILIPADGVCDTFVSPDTADALLRCCKPAQSICSGYPCGEGKCTGLSPSLFAAARAQERFGLTERQRAAIASHMFPLAFSMPRSSEAWIITLADKIVASREMTMAVGYYTVNFCRKLFPAVQ